MMDVKILLVEDDAIEALDIKRTLESFGYTVPFVASKGEEAVKQALELKPDLVLMDIILKGEQNGIGAASEIKDLNIPVIYLTAHSEESTVKKAKLTEPYGYLIKPYDLVELKFAIELALYKSSQEKKLKESEERYRMLFDNSQVATGITSMDGKVLAANRKFSKMIGFSDDQINQIDLRTMYQDITQRNIIIETLKTGGKVREFEVYLRRLDGQPFINSINVDLINYHGEEAMLVTAIDITKRVKAEKNLKETKNYLNSIYEGADIPIVVVDVTEDGDFIINGFNTAFNRLSGLKEMEGVGKPLADFFKQVSPEPGAVDHLYRKYGECVEAGQTIQYEESAEFAGKKRWFMTTVTPLKNAEGEIYRLIVTPIEITQRKMTEEALQNSEKELQLTLDAVSDGVWKWNFQTDELYFSPRYYQMLGYEVDEFPASFESWKSLIHPDDLEDALETSETFFKTQTDFYNNIFRLRTKDGGYRWIQATGRVVGRDETGQAIRMIGNHEDITERKKFEEELLHSNEWLSFTQKASKSGFWDWNMITEQLIWSPEFFELFRLPVDEKPSFDVWLDIMHPDDREGAMKRINQAIEEHKFLVNEYRILAGGEEIWIKALGTTYYDENDQPQRMSGICFDVTQQKEVEIALKESEERFKTIANFTYDWEYWVGPDGKFIYVSPSCERITGYKPREYSQDPSLIEKIIHPDDIQIREKHLREESITEKPPETIQFRIITKNGDERWIEHGCQPVRDDDGVFLGRRVSNRDITEQKKVEKSLRENEEFLDKIVENIPNMIFVKNADDLTFKRVNKAGEYFFGQPAGELIGKSDHDFFPKDVADFFTQKDGEVLQNRKMLDIPEETIETPDLGQRLLHTKKIPILDEEGNPQYLLGISDDITEIKKAENELKNSLKEKEVLLREIHHRVKNNMQIISSILNLQKQFVEDEEAYNVLKESQNRVKSMAMIHERLYQSQDLTKINISEYIERLVSDLYYSYSISTKQVAIIIDVENLWLNIETAVPCGLIISELVSNSLKYAFPHGKMGQISISLKESDDLKELIVSDNGMGFPENIDFKNTETLGLQLVNNLVKQLDGQIKLERAHGTKLKILFKDLDYKKRLNF